MADRETSFLTRWSRRKRDPEKEPDPTVEPNTAERETADQSRTAVPAPQDDGESDEDAGDPEVIAKLPDIESLDETSDFAPFMAEGVPEILRRRALRKLWRLNPVFANLDGLAEYDEDFTDAANLLSEIKTVYKVGRGMVDREAAQKTAETTAEETAEAEGAADPEPAEVQSAESPAETPAVAQASADPLAGEAVSHDKVQPASADEPVLRPEGDGAASRPLPRNEARRLDAGASRPSDAPECLLRRHLRERVSHSGTRKFHVYR